MVLELGKLPGIQPHGATTPFWPADKPDSDLDDEEVDDDDDNEPPDLCLPLRPLLLVLLLLLLLVLPTTFVPDPSSLSRLDTGELSTPNVIVVVF